MVSLVERFRIADLPVSTMCRLTDALGVDVDLRLIVPHSIGRRQRDAAHARCVGYVARRLERAGWLVATEVEVGGGRWLGFVDVLAYHPVEHVLLVIEVKTQLLDIGEVERAIGLYERGCWDSARVRGWRPRATMAVLLVLATDENDRRMVANAVGLKRAFRLRASALSELVRDPRTVPARGHRGLALIDPRSRREAWLIPTWLDGRRTPARYRDREAFLDHRRTAASTR
jgi:hypothetical protein